MLIRERLVYFLIAAACFIMMIGILLFFPKTVWIRGTSGDFIVVIFLYFSFRSAFLLKPLHTFLLSLAISFTVEGLQYFQILKLLNLSDFKVARIIFGSVFDPLDLVAYAAGGITGFFLDSRFLVSEKRQTPL